jgi:hypothetical protein
MSQKKGSENMAERSLAHIEQIANLEPIPGYDRVELATILGWRVVVRKGEFEVGSWCCYFEIDSKLQEKEWSEFLREKHFKVKTQKMCKVISQGLALPIDAIPELQNKTLKVGDDVTELLGVKYSVEEDNIRKSKNGDPNSKYKSMAARHKELFKKKPVRWLMKRNWGRKLLFFFFGKKKDNPKAFPDWIHKTDETRIENAPFYLESKDPWIKTEKIDGTSSTYAIDFMNPKIKKGDFIVCSRNVRQKDEEQACWHECGNVYWEMADKYNIETALRNIAKKFNAKRVVLQGETYGEGIQGNPYKLKERRFAAFNLIIDGIRYSSTTAMYILEIYDIPFVPIIDINYYLPHDMETFKLEADGISTIANVKREGFVYRSKDGNHSFKNVSREFLLKHS